MRQSLPRKAPRCSTASSVQVRPWGTCGSEMYVQRPVPRSRITGPVAFLRSPLSATPSWHSGSPATSAIWPAANLRVSSRVDHSALSDTSSQRWLFQQDARCEFLPVLKIRRNRVRLFKIVYGCRHPTHAADFQRHTGVLGMAA